MDFKEWFPKLSDDTKMWFLQNMETAIPPEISCFATLWRSSGNVSVPMTS